MRHGSLFSGIGGFDLASEWMGWENVFHCEWNEFGQKVLNYYWPKAISYHDITKTDFSVHKGSIDIITGGFPCQPYSTAGKRLGKDDDRHLWPEMLRAIREIQPTWVVGENVLGLVNWDGGLVFHEVQADLEAQGYEVQPYVLSAASVNAPHLRQRIWFVAYTDNKRGCGKLGEIQGQNGKISERNNNAKLSDTSIQSNASDSYGNRSTQYGKDSESKGQSEYIEKQKEWTKHSEQYNELFGFQPDATDSNGIGLRGQSDRIGESRFFDKDGKIANWDNFPTVSPICTRDDGISDRLDSITFSKWRNESIKSGGNAIVPQVVHQIFKAIEQYETTR